MIKLIDKLDSLNFVELPADLRYSSEFLESSVVQKTTRSIGGSFIYQRGKRHKGELITLAGTEQFAPITYGALVLVKALYENVNLTLILERTGYPDIDVIFDYNGGVPVKAEPIIACSDPSSEALYSFVINLRTI